MLGFFFNPSKIVDYNFVGYKLININQLKTGRMKENMLSRLLLVHWLLCFWWRYSAPHYKRNLILFLLSTRFSQTPYLTFDFNSRFYP